MKKAINMLGTIILTVMIIFVPILCMCSYLLNWDADIQYLLTLLTAPWIEMTGTGAMLYAECRSGERRWKCRLMNTSKY